MRISKRGLNLIKEFEGLSLTSYKCPAGIWTIGYGSTGPTVKANMAISEIEAERLLVRDTIRFEKAVEKAVSPMVPSQAEFDAMVSLAFNIGTAAFARSSVARRYKSGDTVGAANAFALWNKATVNGKKVVLKGLVRRRAAEKDLFLSGGSRRAVTRSTGRTGHFVSLPEESVVPNAPKSLTKSREVILGSGLGIGGVTEFVSNVSSDDLHETKSTISEIGYVSEESFAAKYHVPEIAAALCLGIGIFMIWRRFQDRKNGIR